jgi:AraC-like DNA-binding protein
MPARTVLAALSAAVLQSAAEAGLDAEAARRAAGLKRAELDDPDGRVPFAAHAALWEVLSRGGDSVGLEIGQRLGRRGLGVIGHLLASAGTVGEALDAVQEFRAVVLEEAVPRVERSQGIVSLVQSIPPRLARLRHPAEAQASASLLLLRGLVREELLPLRAAFPHPRPADAGAHAALFRCPLEWNAAETSLTFDATVERKRIASADDGLFAFLRRQADRQLAALPREADWVSQCRGQLLRRLPDGEPAAADVARALGTSVRTLHRRLAAEGTAFADLLDEVRAERAEQLVADPGLTLYEVSWLLGYSEQAAFTRAFRRWRGVAPRTWRERSAGARS